MWIAGEDYSSTLFHSLRHANAKEERRKKLGVPLREVVLFFFGLFSFSFRCASVGGEGRAFGSVLFFLKLWLGLARRFLGFSL